MYRSSLLSRLFERELSRKGRQFTIFFGLKLNSKLTLFYKKDYKKELVRSLFFPWGDWLKWRGWLTKWLTFWVSKLWLGQDESFLTCRFPRAYWLRLTPSGWVNLFSPENSQRKMSYGRGDFGGGLGQTGNTGSTGSSSATMDYNRITQVVSANTSKISQHVKEINRLAQQLGTELDNSDIRQQL